MVVPTAVEEEDVDETMVQIPSEDIPRFLGKGCNTQKKIVRASGVESATVKENLEKVSLFYVIMWRGLCC